MFYLLFLVSFAAASDEEYASAYWCKPGNMSYTLKNGSHVEKWVTRKKVGHTSEKQDPTWKSRSHLEKLVAKNEKNESHLKNRKRPHLERWIKLGKMGHTLKNRSHLRKWVTLKKRILLGKISHTD